jgi:hypothetical protein
VYQFSRALYRELKPRVVPDPHHPGAVERRLLSACEQTLERLATDPRYFARPARSLFAEVRCFFGVCDQLGVYERIDARISEAQRFLEDAERLGAAAYLLRCRATTRKGRACQRVPLPSLRYCPSHRHLERREGSPTPTAAGRR